MTTPNDNNGHDETMATDPSLDRFAQSLRAGLPRLSRAAMARIERAMSAELDRAYPPAPLPLAMPAGGWRRWGAIAAMFLLVGGFAMRVSLDPVQPALPVVASRVVDEFGVVIDPAPSATQVSQWDALATSLERYASLIGLERFARR
jgi:hypothetical protein